MATRAAATAAKAIYAEPAFIPKGPINAGRFNLIREIAIGFTLGLTGGMMWKVRTCSNWGDDAVFDAAEAAELQAGLPTGVAAASAPPLLGGGGSLVPLGPAAHHRLHKCCHYYCFVCADVALGRKAASGTVLL
jgi:hypothetical protein